MVARWWLNGGSMMAQRLLCGGPLVFYGERTMSLQSSRELLSDGCTMASLMPYGCSVVAPWWVYGGCPI
eukprot:11202233-Lingulodinium_polyedra.AAC.1